MNRLSISDMYMLKNKINLKSENKSFTGTEDVESWGVFLTLCVCCKLYEETVLVFFGVQCSIVPPRG